MGEKGKGGRERGRERGREGEEVREEGRVEGSEGVRVSRLEERKVKEGKWEGRRRVN